MDLGFCHFIARTSTSTYLGYIRGAIERLAGPDLLRGFGMGFSVLLEWGSECKS